MSGAEAPEPGSDASSDGASSGADPYSVDAARQAAARGALNDWVAQFLGSPGSDNAPLGRELTDPPRWWLGPLPLPIDELHRLAGPADEPVLCPTDDDDWGDDVDEMEHRIRGGWTPPPVVVSYRDDGAHHEQLVLEDGNHRVESLRRAGHRQAWAVVAFGTAEERDRFSPPPAS